VTDPVPSVGRAVHYVSYGTPGGEYGKACRAATITEVSQSAIGLCVMNPAGLFFNQDVHSDSGKPHDLGRTDLCHGLDYEGGTWHWPERV
jgi:hypothetical protein